MLTVHSAPPAPPLRPFIRAYVQRKAELGAEELIEPVIARLGVMLEFEFAGAYEVLDSASNIPDATYPITIIGPQTSRRVRLMIRGDIESLVVLFQPAGFRLLFGAPTLPLAMTGTEGHGALGASISQLHQSMGNMATFAERVDAMNRYFLGMLDRSAQTDPVMRGIQSLTDPGSAAKVGSLARELGVSVRHLERKSLEYVGMPPKTFARVARFTRALQLRRQSGLNWTQIAHETSYHDHMHMIRDFREFAGKAPSSALREIAPDHLINYCAQ
jgi:AraC-like DNA-binding protein